MAWLSTLVTVLVIVADPWEVAIQPTLTHWSTWMMIATEAASIPFIGLSICLCSHGSARRAAWLIAYTSSLAVPALMLADAFAWHWIGEHLLSQTMWIVGSEKADGLAGHISMNVARGIGQLAITATACVAAIVFASRVIGRMWASKLRWLSPRGVYAASLLLLLIASVQGLYHRLDFKASILRTPFQHPWSSLGLVRWRPPSENVASQDHSTIPSFAESVQSRLTGQRLLTVNFRSSPARRPDILIVIVESFRSELIHTEAMPQLTELASRSLDCRAHFSGGNATSHGIFSLVNGVEAIWHDTPLRYSPLLNRLLRQSGYELGFFGGHDDWRKFQMDGYISSEQFDQFEIAPSRGLASDRRATQLAASFLQRQFQEDRPPRLAMLYLYATHAPYASYVDDQVFHPAADDRFIIPYTVASRDEVWNRYQNSARTIDRLVAPLLQSDRIVIVTGDHGESFLEDATIGHGIRMSRFQNMTSAIFYAPGITPRMINEPTMHADLLPTLIASLDLQVNDERVFDGVDLIAAHANELQGRVFATRDYLHDHVALVGPWTLRPDQPFAYTASVSLKSLHARPLQAIDHTGKAIDSLDSAAFDRWLSARFGGDELIDQRVEAARVDKSEFTSP